MLHLPRFRFFWGWAIATSIFAVVALILPIDTTKSPSIQAQETIEVDALVLDASLGGVSAAITLAREGKTVVLMTSNTIVGGQAVESGISAFDDLGNPWEDNLLYGELQQYLKDKYGNSKGLGSAVAGAIATLPTDIQDFFLSKIAENPRITLLNNHRLIESKNKNIYRATVLENLTTRQRVLVRSSFLVLASKTGHWLEELAEPFDVGFDSREDTREPDALPASVRDAFIQGINEGETQFSGWENRVQAVSSPFVLLDKGYGGDFFSISNFPNSGCWKHSETGSFIVGGLASRATTAACVAEMTLQPNFSDTYEMYFINHGNDSFDVTIRWPSPSASLNISISSAKSERLVKIGTFFVDPQHAPSLSFQSKGEHFSVEGIILKKTNLHASSSFLSAPFSETVIIKRSGFPLVMSDIYLALPKEKNPSSLKIKVNDRSYNMTQVGSGNYLLSNITLGLTGSIILPPEIHEIVSAILIFPTGLSTQHRIMVRWQSVETKEESAENSNNLKWDFTVAKSGEYLLGISQTRNRWFRVAVNESKTGKKITSFSFNNIYSNNIIRPLQVIHLNAGVFYRLEVNSPDNDLLTPPIFSLEDLASSNWTYNKTENKTARVSSLPSIAIYDVWIRSPDKGKARVQSTLTYLQNSRKWVPIKDPNTFTYAGKFFVYSKYAISTDGANEMLVLPSLQTDTFNLEATPQQNNLTVDISSLPPGKWRTVIGGVSSGQPDSLTSIIEHLQEEKIIPDQDIALFPTTGSLINKSAFLHQGPSKISVPMQSTRPNNIWFFEDIPDLTPSWQFSLTRKVIGEMKGGEKTPLFLLRNIVSAQSIASGTYTAKIHTPVANTSMGVTIVAEPVNDLAPVYVGSIDSYDVIEGSRERSYQYYYWLKYMMPLFSQLFECDTQDDVTCSMKRVNPLLGIFPGSPGFFPILPYSREGRRAKTIEQMNEMDFLLSLQPCSGQSDECNNSLCVGYIQNHSFCITKKQTAEFPHDAVAAVHYGIDLHSYFTAEEYFGNNGISQFLDYFQKKNLLQKDSSHPLHLVEAHIRPSSLKMGALIPQKSDNIVLASNNIGATQLANGLLRIHVNEIAIGQSAGFLTAFCLDNKISPKQLLNDDVLLHQFQHYLVEGGVIIYPIQDMSTDPILSKSVQHLLIDGLIKQSIVPYIPPSKSRSFKFVVDADKPLSTTDVSLINKTLGDGVSLDTVSPENVLSLLGNNGKALSEQNKQTLLNKIGFSNKKGIVRVQPTKAHLFRIIYLFKAKELHWSNDDLLLYLQ